MLLGRHLPQLPQKRPELLHTDVATLVGVEGGKRLLNLRLQAREHSLEKEGDQKKRAGGGGRRYLIDCVASIRIRPQKLHS